MFCYCATSKTKPRRDVNQSEIPSEENKKSFQFFAAVESEQNLLLNSLGNSP
jgi:hypothetical protein